MIMLWLLGQTLGFPLPPLPSVAERELATRPAFDQCQMGNAKVGYDGRSLFWLVYDAVFPSATTDGLSDPVETVPTIPAYDSCSVSNIRVVGYPRSAPGAKTGYDLAKLGRSG